SFIWPTMLLFLAVLPLLVLLYVLLLRRRRRMLAAYGALGFGAPSAAGRRSLGARRHLPPALFFLGLASLVVALARPQAIVSIPRVQGTVVLAFDVSGSMAATDM